MNWTEILSNYQAQGTIFWVAAFSIAAGATLLLVSGMVLAKRGLVRTHLNNLVHRRKKSSHVLPSSAAVGLVQKNETGYEAQALNSMVAEKTLLEPTPSEWQQLNNRLKGAANTLEEIHNSLKNQDASISGSTLKVPGKEVEYVFKTGIA